MDTFFELHWIDASRPLAPGIPVWPSDHPFELRTRELPDMVLSSFSTTTHVGTHLDAPLHLAPGKASVDEIPLSLLMGPADLVHVPTAGPITPADLPADWRPATPRLLLRTDSFPLGATPGPGFASLHPETARWLADMGIRVVGLDTPSVDAFDDPAMTSHRALDEAGLIWIENLWLADVPTGRVHMIALPLPLVGAEASPIRVLLAAAGKESP